MVYVLTFPPSVWQKSLMIYPQSYNHFLLRIAAVPWQRLDNCGYHSNWNALDSSSNNRSKTGIWLLLDANATFVDQQPQMLNFHINSNKFKNKKIKNELSVIFSHLVHLPACLCLCLLQIKVFMNWAWWSVIMLIFRCAGAGPPWGKYGKRWEILESN